MEKQYSIGAPMVGTLRRRVGSKAYLFEQRKDEMDEENAETVDGSLSGTYVEVSVLSFYNQKSADMYTVHLQSIVNDDREAEAFFELYPLKVDAQNQYNAGGISYLYVAIGTYQQFVDMHKQYDLYRASKGMIYEDAKIAKQMEDQNGMSACNSNVYVVKSHRALQDIASTWNQNPKFDMQIVVSRDVGVVGGWRTMQNFFQNNDNWIGVVGEFEFESFSDAKSFKLAAEKLSKQIAKRAAGLEKEMLKGEIEPVNITYQSTDIHVEKTGIFSGTFWGDLAQQKFNKAKWCNIFVFGPGISSPEVNDKIAAINGEANASCTIVQSILQ
eukprot:m.1148315 g.1148315  ORF g.1148315 m.1148315 type:complete len:328 (+) comp24475_c1_seq8:411-1394(+)